MPWTSLPIFLWLPGFALVLSRIAGLLVTAPIIGSAVIPARVKVALSFVAAAVIFPTQMSRLPTELSLGSVLIGSVGELMIGLIIGLGMTLIISGAELAGTLVGQQAGIALASVIDPSQDESSTVVGQIFVITMTLIFLVIGGHRDMAMAVLDTFEVVPVLSFTVNDSIVTLMADLLTASFILGIKLFSPVMIALLLLTVVMGFLSRTIPQLNILSVGFVVRSLAALGMAGLALAVSRELLVDALLDAMEWIRVALGLSPTHLAR